jgi:hypothetical protein
MNRGPNPTPTLPFPFREGEGVAAHLPSPFRRGGGGEVLLILLFLSACLPTPTPLPPLPTATPSPPTATPTATPVWFPPTATYTPLPFPTAMLTATLDVRPQYGALLFSEDFANPEHWRLSKSPDGSVALGNHELSLGTAQPRAYLSSLLQEARLDDFYLEINAAPSLCSGADEYGLLLRVSPGGDFFRFGLNCAGQARLDRFLGGIASSPMVPQPFGSIPPGAPSSSRLGVWAVGKELRFYANGEYLFSVSDASLPAGTIGVFVRAAADGPVTVNFSDLQVYRPAP